MDNGLTKGITVRLTQDDLELRKQAKLKLLASNEKESDKNIFLIGCEAILNVDKP